MAVDGDISFIETLSLLLKSMTDMWQIVTCLPSHRDNHFCELYR
jgi:hypothetical protein